MKSHRGHPAGSAPIWLLAGLALAVGIGALGWPWIRQMQQDAIVSSTRQGVKMFRDACTSFYAKQAKFPPDGTEGVRHPEGGYVRAPEGRDLAPVATTFGDILVATGYLPEIRFPFGGQPELNGWYRGQEIWPEIRALPVAELQEKFKSKHPFQSASSATTVVVLTVPGLELGQAALLKRALDPLSPGEEQRSDTQILRLGLAGSVLAKGDVRFTQDDSFGIFTAWVYLAHN
jgi:hypothetical protein